jgi:hypothetical protein
MPPKAEKTDPAWRKPPTQAAAFTIEEFCRAHRLSPSMFHKLRTQGEGPRVMKVGTRTMVSKEAAADWRAEREAATQETDAA